MSLAMQNMTESLMKKQLIMSKHGKNFCFSLEKIISLDCIQLIYIFQKEVSLNKFRIMPVLSRGEIWFKFYPLDSTHSGFFADFH